MRLSAFHTAAVFGALLGSGPGAAQTLDMLLAPRPDTAACWQRSYSDAHLARHPRQKVTQVRFDLYYSEMEHHVAGEGSYAFSIQFTTPTREGWTGGLCYEDARGKVICGGDCDSGALAVRNSGTEGSLLLEMLSGGMTLTDCGDETPFYMSAEPDDKLFLVHPASCPTVE